MEDTDEAVVALMIMKKMMRAMCRLSLSSSNSDQHLRRQYLRRDELSAYCCRRPCLHRCRDHSFEKPYPSPNRSPWLLNLRGADGVHVCARLILTIESTSKTTSPQTSLYPQPSTTTTIATTIAANITAITTRHRRRRGDLRRNHTCRKSF